jgi:hypothetical protein
MPKGVNVGSIYYEVDADTTAIIKAEAKINESLDNVTKDFVKAEKAVVYFQKRMSEAGFTINRAGQVLGKNGNVVKSLSIEYRGLANAADKARNAVEGVEGAASATTPKMSRFAQISQNAGYQITDFSNQISGGQSAVLAFSQQLPQLIGGLGAAGSVIGALVAIAGGLYLALNKDKDAVKGLDQALESLSTIVEKTSSGMNVLTNEAYELSKISKEAAKLQLASAILKARTELEKVSGSAEEAFRSLQKTFSPDDIEIATKAIKTLGTEFARSGETALETFNRLISAPAALSSEISQLNNNLTSTMKSLGVTRDQAFGLVEALAKFKETKSPEELIKIANEVSALGLSQKNLAPEMQKFVQKISELGIKALRTADGLKQAEKLINSFEASVKESNPEVVKAKESIEGMVSALKLQADTYGVTDRATALHVAYLKGATQAEFDAINASYDKIEAYEQEVQSNKDRTAALKEYEDQMMRDLALEAKLLEAQRKKHEQAAAFAEGISGRGNPQQVELEQLASYYTQKMITTEMYEDALTQIIREKGEERAKVELQRNNTILSSSSQFFDAAAGLASSFAGEQSGAYKVLFGISKGFAAAQAAMNLSLAISQASTLPWPANIPAMAQAAASGASLISSISGASYSGSRNYGGGVGYGSNYEVAEGGRTELYVPQHGNPMLMGSKGGQVVSNSDLMSAMNGGGQSAPPVINIYNMPGQSATVESNNNAMSPEYIIKIVADNTMSPGSRMQRALSSSTTAKPRIS